MNVKTGDKILELVQKALEEINSPKYSISGLIRTCIRIARLRNDFDNLLWLEYELMPILDKESKKKIFQEVARHYTREELESLSSSVTSSYINERACREYDTYSKKMVDKGNICLFSVPEIEKRIEQFQREAKDTPPNGLHPVDLYFVEKEYTGVRTLARLLENEYSDILKKIEYRIHEFLSITEKQLIYNQINADIFERNKRYVDERLRSISPETFDQFASVYRLMNEQDEEGRSQAALSCRRILKTIADIFYPVKDEPVIGSDGKRRILSDDKYISRLWQFIFEKMKSSGSRELLLSQLSDVGNRIDRLYELTSKGVHADVSEFEINQCVIQTYLTVGDILRVADNKSHTDDETINDLLKIK